MIMSSPIQCLVSWKERKKIVSISGHTMEDLFAAVKATDFGDVASIGRIEVRSGNAFCSCFLRFYILPWRKVLVWMQPQLNRVLIAISSALFQT